jgi:hypothetical protein
LERQLKKKKDEMVEHLQAIDDRMHEVSTNCSVIQKDIVMEFEGGIIKRLHDSRGTKLAVLQKDIA